ncbi:hypothetical protein D3C75_1286470 [compost metagenome]
MYGVHRHTTIVFYRSQNIIIEIGHAGFTANHLIKGGERHGDLHRARLAVL